MKTNEYCCDNPECPNYHKDELPDASPEHVQFISDMAKILNAQEMDESTLTDLLKARLVK